VYGNNTRNNARCTQARKTTHGLDSIKTWTGLSVEESVRMIEDRDKWRKYVHGVANPWIVRTAEEQNGSVCVCVCVNAGVAEVTSDVLGLMMLARDSETGEGMSTEQLRDQVMNLMMAGHEVSIIIIIDIFKVA